MLDRMWTVVVGGTGAVAATQFPAYYLQYKQRLGGFATKAQDNAQSHMDNAAARGLELKAYADQLREGGFPEQAETLLQQVASAEALTKQYAMVSQAAWFEQPFILARVFSSRIGQDAWQDMSWALPLNASGFVYAFIGMVLALILWALVLLVPRGIARLHHWMRSLMMMQVSRF
jgi:hypothetical protein